MKKIIIICLISVSCSKQKSTYVVVNNDPLISYYKDGENLSIYHSDFELNKSDSLHAEGVQLGMANNFKKARKKLLQALRIEPNHSVILNDIGNIEYGDKNFEKAIEYYNKAFIASDSTYLFAGQNLAMTYSRIGNMEKSEKIFKIIISKTDIEFLKGVYNYSLAKMYLDYGEIEKGLIALQKAKLELSNYKDFRKELDNLQLKIDNYYN